MSTKIHMLTDASGRPVRFTLTAGQANDAKGAELLLEGVRTRGAIADKGYDSERILEKVEDLGADAVIPPRSNRKVQREYDKELYKERNLIERAFNKLKRFRRIATRYDQEVRVLQILPVSGRFPHVALMQLSIRPSTMNYVRELRSRG